MDTNDQKITIPAAVAALPLTISEKIILSHIANFPGWTATMWAASAGQVRTLKMILTKNPNVNAVNKDGKSALMIAKTMNQAAAVVALKDAGGKE